jgi:hypothetical protein
MNGKTDDPKNALLKFGIGQRQAKPYTKGRRIGEKIGLKSMLFRNC